MLKYKLVIQKHTPDYQITMKFEEKYKKDAIEKSQEILNDVAEQFSDGYYTAKLYRKYLILGWCRVSTPEIACNNTK